MLARNSLLAVTAVLALGLAACGDARPLQATSGTGGALCVSCHGGVDNATGAPPDDLAGNVATTARGVGAHSAHVVAGPLAGAFACAECHEAVTTLDSPGHRNGTVDLPFGALAKTGGVSPLWDPVAAGGPSCSSVYCHGNFTGGNSAAPVWTKVGQGEAACGTCHDRPPASPHPAIGAFICNDCHVGTVKIDGTIDVAGSLHVNGAVDVKRHDDPSWVTAGGGNHTGAALNQNPPFASCLQCHTSFGSAFGIAGSSCNDCHLQTATSAGWLTADWQQNCVFCHGDKSKIATWTSDPVLHPLYEIAPPRGALGETLTTDIHVGAHQQHVNPGTNALSNAIACAECHPSLPTNIAHVDGTAEVPLSGLLATNNGTVTPTWNTPVAAGCAATYCHGNYPQGGNNATPLWTTVNGSFAACTSCHGAPPNTGEHYFHMFTEGLNCSYCHSGIATGSGSSAPVTNATIVGESLHVNGVRNVVLSVTGSWTPAPTPGNAAGGSCTNVLCHGAGTKTW